MEDAKKKRLGAGKVAFFARIDKIKARIDARHTMITVYEEFEKDLGISYGQFVNYVNKEIKGKTNDENKGKKPEEEVKPAAVDSGIPEFKRSGKRNDLYKPKP